jgi:pilus assembly protein CpaE
MHMRLQARSTWTDLLGRSDLEWNMLKSRLLSHQSGLQVLAAPTKPESPTSLTAQKATRILHLLREQTSFTIIDLPNAFSPSFTAGLENADIALHVITPELVAVQTAAKLDRALSKAGMTFRQKSYILNQVKGESQLPRETVERGLKSRIAFNIGYDPNQEKALSQGVPLALTSAQSPLAIIARKMAEVIWKRVGGGDAVTETDSAVSAGGGDAARVNN